MKLLLVGSRKEKETEIIERDLTCHLLALSHERWAMSRGMQSLEQLLPPASKETEMSVLQSHGTELCPQPSEPRNSLFPEPSEMKVALSF